jgi:hypothetical protein
MHGQWRILACGGDGVPCARTEPCGFIGTAAAAAILIKLGRFQGWYIHQKHVILHYIGESRYCRYDLLICMKKKEMLQSQFVEDSRSGSGSVGFTRHFNSGEALHNFKSTCRWKLAGLFFHIAVGDKNKGQPKLPLSL